MYATQAKSRPAWWKPEAILELLLGGEPVSALCRRASEECEGRVKTKTFRSDISVWAGSLTWGDQFAVALAIYKHGGAGRGLLLSDAWFPEFYQAMEQSNGKVEEACELSGFGADLIYALRNPRSKLYNKAFAEEVDFLEGSRLSRIREHVLNSAENDDPRLGEKVLQAAMPHLHAPAHKLEVSGGVDVNMHLIPPEVVAASQARTRTLLANRGSRELQEGARATIDLPAALVKQTA